jgi:putative DNA primase/helicase
MNEVIKHVYSLEKGDSQADEKKVARHNRTWIETIPEDRRKRAFAEVMERFATVGKDTQNYVDRDSGEVAFHDSGEKLSTRKNDPDVAVALVKMAEAKGWTDIKVNGHPDFKRGVWLEASLKGIEVSGFTPTDKDVFALEERRRQSMRNVVQRDDLPGADKTARAGAGAVKERAAPVAKTEMIEGTLVEHGAAPYQHDKKNQPSYFVRVKNEEGAERTAWGVNLRRAVEKSGAVSGDRVRLENKGNQEVTVTTAIRNQDGKITGYREKDVRRTLWNVEKTPGQNLTLAMALAVVKKNGIDPESPRGKQFLQAIGAEAAKREEKGKLPKIPIRDIKAPIKMREADKTKPRPRRGTVKKEKEVQQTR